MEHRCGRRRDTRLRVTIRTRSGVATEAQVSNISSSGAFVRAHLPLTLNSVVYVQFWDTVPGKRPRGEAIPAEVVRHCTEGFALEWTEFSPQTIRSIVRELTFADTDHAPWSDAHTRTETRRHRRAGG